MKAITLVKSLIVFLLIGCIEPKYEKPFVIIRVYKYDNRDSYWYQDNNGNLTNFESLPDQYHVGDTIY